jgi:lysophospholipase L1-like esterase
MLNKKIFFLIIISFLLSITSCKKAEKEEKQIDLTKFPNYIENFQEIDYSFSDTELMTPFWKGNVIYNESVLLIDDGNKLTGKLQFIPLKIISIKDFTLNKEYKEGIDFEVKDNIINSLPGSTMPYLLYENLTGQNIPEPYREVSSISNIQTDYVLMGANIVYTESPFWYGNQVYVSYVYDVKDIDLSYYANYDEKTLPNLMNKLKNEESVNIIAIGDSVLEGCSSSGHFNREPFMPNFMELTKKGLEDKYKAEINLNNISVGGKTSAWGSSEEAIANINTSNPDVIFIHFGINDAGSGFSPNSYRDNIELIILSAREANPNTEFIILTAFSPNDKAYDTSRLENYWDKIREISERYSGVKVIDIWKVSRYMLKEKKYEDLTGNGINHVNDYSSRIYLMSILATLVEY